MAVFMCQRIRLLDSRVVSSIPVGVVASVVGQIMSMSLALGPVARLRTRAMYAVINSCTSWSAYVRLTEESMLELEFWQENVAVLNTQPIWFKPGATQVIYSDASDSGYGGYSFSGCWPTYCSWLVVRA